MATREKISNNAISYLVSSLDDSETGVEVTDATNFPSSGRFVIIIDNEIMYVTAVAGNVFTVVRGHENTTAIAHTSGAIVAHIISAGAWQRYCRDSVPFFDDANRYPYNRCEDASGNTLTAASFTAGNQGSSALTDLDCGGIELFIPADGGNDLRAWYKSAPTAPYKITACFLGYPGKGNNGTTLGAQFGMGFYDAVSGKVHYLDYAAGLEEFSVTYWPSFTNYGSQTFTDARDVGGNPVWFQVEDDGTNLKYYISHNGITFQQIYTELHTATLDNQPNNVLFGGNDNRNINGFYVSLLSWIEE